jgi:hypothetical protein
MSFLGERNAIALGVSQHTVLGSGPLLTQLSPSLLLQFAGAQTMDPRITFTRASTATFTGQDGLIQTAAINAPRFDYDPVTLAPLGLLIEESRTNLLLYSEQFDNAAWTKTETTVTADAAVAPDGTSPAEKLIPTITNSTHACFQNASVTTGVTYTQSFFAKAAEYPVLNCYGSTGFSGTAFINFNLSTGTVGTLSGFTGSITPVGNGWYRCVIVATATSTTASGRIIFRASPINRTTGGSYTGNGTSGLLVWGAQLEAGAFATSYIPTVASQVTRAADLASMTGTNFSSWFNASQGTFAATYEASPNTFTTYLVASNGVTAQNSFHFDNDSGNMRAVYYSGSSAVAILSLGAVGTVGTVNKVASAYQVNDFAASRNAGTVVTDTAGAVPVSLTQLNIGADPSGAAVNVMNTHIRQIVYYPRRLSNAELQGITA